MSTFQEKMPGAGWGLSWAPSRLALQAPEASVTLGRETQDVSEKR